MAEPELPDDLILPIPEDKKEQDFFKTLLDYAKSINKAFAALADPIDEKVKASSSDPTADYLDGKVDGVTIDVISDQLVVLPSGVFSGIAGSGLSIASNVLEVNVDNSTIEINSDILRVKDNGITDSKIRLTNNGWLVGRNQANNANINIVKVGTNNYLFAGSALSLLSGVFADEFSSDGTLGGNSDTAIPTEKAVKTYVDANINTTLSNCVFEWHGQSSNQGSNVGHCSATTVLGSVTGQYVSLRNNTNSFVTILIGKFKKIAGISTLTILANIAGASGNTDCKVDVGGQNNTVTTASTTPVWATSANIDVSGLSNGTTYDITVQLKNDASDIAGLFHIQLIAS